MTEMKALNTKIDRKCDSWHETMEKVIKESQDKINMELEKTAKVRRDNLELEVGIMSSRLEKIESKFAT